MRHSVLRWSLLVSLVLVAWPALAQPKGEAAQWASTAQQLSREIVSLGERIQALQPEGYLFNMDERVLNAELLFELGQYDSAAQLLTSLVNDKRFDSHPSHWRAARLLGVTLYKMGNYLAAYKQFDRCVQAGKEMEASLGFMIEIAARLGRLEDLSRLAAKIDEAWATPALLYAKGKALYLVDDFARAAATLNKVPMNSPDARKARYLLGASLVALGQHKDALQVYEALSVSPPPVTEEETEIHQLTFMALGRLAYHLGDFSKAVDYYQEIPKDSPLFERTLFEVVSTYLQWTRKQASAEVRFERLRRAADLLMTLRDVAKDPEVLRQSLVLSGRISMQLERWDEAQDAFEKVVQEFSFASGELSDLVKDQVTIERFFDALVAGNLGGDGQVFVSKGVVDWLTQQPSLGRVMALLQDLARQKKDLEEAESIYQSIKHVVDTAGGQPMLSGYGELLFTALELEVRLLDLDAALMAASRDAAHKNLSGSNEAESLRLEQVRTQLLEEFAKAPRKVEGYTQRVAQHSDRIRAMAQEAYSHYLTLMAQQEQLAALERLLKDAKYRGGALASLDAEKDVRKEMDSLAAQIATLLKTTQDIRHELEAEGSVDDASAASPAQENVLRERLWKHLEQEALFYNSARKELSGDEQSKVNEAMALHAELVKLLSQLRNARTVLFSKSSALAKSLDQILADERRELDARSRELVDAQRVCLAFAKDVGVALLVKAKEDLVRSVVEADLGLVDLLWQQKRVYSDRIEAMNEERYEATKWIAAELNAIQDEIQREKEEQFLEEGEPDSTGGAGEKSGAAALPEREAPSAPAQPGGSQTPEGGQPAPNPNP